MRKLIVYIIIALLVGLQSIGTVWADESSTVVDVTIAPGVIVSVPTTFAVSDLAVATDSQGKEIVITDDPVSIQLDVGNPVITLPIDCSEGQNIVSFYDPETGIELSGGKLTVPIKNPDGDTLMTINADVDVVQAEGCIELVPTNMVLKLNELPADLSQEDGAVGQIEVSFEVDLKSLPEGVSVTTFITKEADPDAQTAFELASTKDNLVVVDVAYTLNIVKTNLENGTNLGEATIVMKVGRAWVDKYGTENVHIIRYGEDGESQVLDIRFIGYEGEQAVFEADSPAGLSVFGLASLLQRLPTTTNWWLIIGIAGGAAVVVAVFAFLIIRRRRAREAALRQQWPTGLKPEDWEELK